MKQASTSTLTSSSNPSRRAKQVRFTAKVTKGTTGLVTFKDGETTLGTGTIKNGTATYTTSASLLTVGNHAITAVYGGDDRYAASTSKSLTQQVKA